MSAACGSLPPRCGVFWQLTGSCWPNRPPRDPAPRVLWPDWLKWEPNKIWCWDVTHFPRARRAAFAIVDVVSRRWIDTLVSIEETSTQVRVIFDRALATEGLAELITPERVEQFRKGPDPAHPVGLLRQRPPDDIDSHPGPLRRASSRPTPRTSPHPHRPGLDREPLRARQSREPHLEAIRDPAALDAELQRARRDYNQTRLHAAIGYVTPDDEHTGLGQQIRQARTEGLRRAREQRLDYHRRNHNNNPQEPT